MASKILHSETLKGLKRVAQALNVQLETPGIPNRNENGRRFRVAGGHPRPNTLNLEPF